MVDFLKKNINSKKRAYLLFFLIILIIHHFFNFMNDDITFFSKALDNSSLFTFISGRYNTWSSRIIIESFLVIISRNIYVWRILNSLVIVLLVYSIEELFCYKKNNINIIMVMLLFFIYPYYQMAEAGFAATTLNYLWPLTFLLYSFVPLKKIYINKEYNKKLLPLNILSFIFACNQEQAVCIAVVVSLLFFIYCLKNKKKDIYPFILLCISFLSLLFILTCPGNGIRKIAEIENCFPDFVNASFLDKIYLGVISTCSILISNFLILFLFSFLIFFIVLKKSNNKFMKIINIIQFIIVLSLSLYRVYIFLKCDSILDAYLYGIFYYQSEIGNVFNLSISSLFPFVVCLVMVFVYILLLYNIFCEKSYYLIFILLLGCGTRLLMGFSPTIFDSGSRTMIFLYFSIIVLIIYLIDEFRKLFSSNKLMFLYVIIGIFIIINYYLTFKAIPLINNL